jgi:adenine-specific DNA glycosylase
MIKLSICQEPPVQQNCTNADEANFLDAPVVIPRLKQQRAIITIANTLSKERRLIEQLVTNGVQMMSAVAKDLHTAHSH